MTEISYDRPIQLQANRVYKPFVGGKLLDALEEKVICSDGHYGERWISSITAATDGDGGSEGLSLVKGTKTFLKTIIDQQTEACLGKDFSNTNGSSFGMLLKLLDSKQRLLIQVHPDKERAESLFDSKYGKTEAWHVLGTRTIDGQAPYILLGFKEGITREWYIDKFKRQDIEALENCMHKIEVAPGDTYYIPGGLPHAVGSGCLIAEIQEPTDYTIRSEITAVTGEPLPAKAVHQGLGYEKMFDCYDFKGMDRKTLLKKYQREPVLIVDSKDYQVTSLISEKVFGMELRQVSGEVLHRKTVPFEVLIVLKGKGKVICDETVIEVGKGDEFFIPNGVEAYRMVSDSDAPMEIIACTPPVLD